MDKYSIKHKIPVIICLAVILLLALSACGKEKVDPNTGKGTADAMSSHMTFQAYGESAQDVVDQAVSMMYKMDSEISLTNKKSQITQLNNHHSATVSGNTLAIIKDARDLSAETEGAFDITVEPLVDLWGFVRGPHKVPDQDELDALLPHIGMSHVTITDITADSAEVTFDDPSVGLDLGAIAKGYAAERVHDLFLENGITSALIDMGTTICFMGSKQNGDAWSVGIENPVTAAESNSSKFYKTKDKPLGTLSLSDCYLAVTNNYTRCFTEDEITYCHIIDPATGLTVDNDLTSVTVVSSSGSQADALSTALFVMGLDEATSFWKTSSLDFQAIFITDDNTIYITEGLEASFHTSKKYKVIH